MFRSRVPSGGGSNGGSVSLGLVLSSDWWRREGAGVSYEEFCGEVQWMCVAPGSKVEGVENSLDEVGRA